MEILNSGNKDCHAHTSNFSDGMSSVEEMVSSAVSFGIEELWLTDHSEACYKFFGFGPRTPRGIAKRWNPLQEGIVVRFGVECDLMDEDGDVCDHIQGQSSEYLILSAHKDIFGGRPEMITEAYIKAIQKHGNRFKFIGHPCACYFSEHLKIDELVGVANEHNIPLEINCANLFGDKTDLEKLRYLMRHADRVYLNSDAHTLQQLRDLREVGLGFVRQVISLFS